MSEREPIRVINLDRYGFPASPWSRPRDLLAAGPPPPGTPFFLGTCRPDGRPDAAGIGASGVRQHVVFDANAAVALE